VEAVLHLEVDWKVARNNVKIKGEFDGWRGKFYRDGESTELSYLCHWWKGR